MAHTPHTTPVLLLPFPQIFFISLFIAILSYKKDQSWHWVSVGMLVDFCLRFYVSAFCTV